MNHCAGLTNVSGPNVATTSRPASARARASLSTQTSRASTTSATSSGASALPATGIMMAGSGDGFEMPLTLPRKRHNGCPQHPYGSVTANYSWFKATILGSCQQYLAQSNNSLRSSRSRGGEEGREPFGKSIGIRLLGALLWGHQPCPVHLLQTVLEHRSVAFLKQFFVDVHFVIAVDA